MDWDVGSREFLGCADLVVYLVEFEYHRKEINMLRSFWSWKIPVCYMVVRTQPILIPRWRGNSKQIFSLRLLAQLLGWNGGSTCHTVSCTFRRHRYFTQAYWSKGNWSSLHSYVDVYEHLMLYIHNSKDLASVQTPSSYLPELPYLDFGVWFCNIGPSQEPRLVDTIIPSALQRSTDESLVASRTSSGAKLTKGTPFSKH